MKNPPALVAPALALSLVLALPSAGRGACRDGDSGLADERALAAVRGEIAEACPCASYDGSPGRRRSDYEGCAGEVIAVALARGDLSEECGTAARGVVEGSVCGTRGVPCASVVGSAEPRVSCRVTHPASCRATRGSGVRRLPRVRLDAPAGLRRPTSPFGRGSAGRSACSEQQTCADVVEWTAGTCVDTREDGPYAAGFRDVRLVKESAASPGTERVLDAVVWYPAPPGSGPIESDSRAVRDAPLDPSGAPYALLMFSHGSCGFERQSLFLTPWLATHGFIVVAVPHPGNTLFDFPDCGTPPAQAASAIERPRDVRFALDFMLAADRDPASSFFGTVDEERLGMSGHSFGGLTTYLAIADDDRYVAAMPLAAATGQSSALDVPSLTMLGGIDSVVNNDGIRAAFARSDRPKLLVEVEDAGHYAFSDGCFPSPDCNPPETATQDEAHERVKRWALPFLKVYLAGDESFAPLLETRPPPGVEVESR